MSEINILTIQGQLNQPSEAFLQCAIGEVSPMIAVHNRQDIVVHIARYILRGPLTLHYRQKPFSDQERHDAQVNIALQSEIQNQVLRHSLGGCAIEALHVEDQPVSGLEAGIRFIGRPNVQLLRLQQQVHDAQARGFRDMRRPFQAQDAEVLVRFSIPHTQRARLKDIKERDLDAYTAKVTELAAAIEDAKNQSLARVEAFVGRIDSLHFKPAQPRLVRRTYQGKK